MELDHRTPLRRAVDKLIYDGKIKQDKDLQEIFNLKKSTISAYLNNPKPGKRFAAEFEKKFGVSLKEFDTNYQPDFVGTDGNRIMIAETKRNTGVFPFDAGESIRKTEIMVEVLLSCVAELLADKHSSSASVLQKQLEAVVNARLNNKEP